MTPYRERREAGFYSKTGKTVPSTTTETLGGLGAPQKAEPKKPPSTEKKAGGH